MSWGFVLKRKKKFFFLLLAVITDFSLVFIIIFENYNIWCLKKGYATSVPPKARRANLY